MIPLVSFLFLSSFIAITWTPWFLVPNIPFVVCYDSWFPLSLVPWSSMVPKTQPISGLEYWMDGKKLLSLHSFLFGYVIYSTCSPALVVPDGVISFIPHVVLHWWHPMPTSELLPDVSFGGSVLTQDRPALLQITLFAPETRGTN